MTPYHDILFPKDFRWGSATAALQTEGAAFRDGRSASVWDHYCETYPERIYQSASPAVACDHYNRWTEDIEWMKKLGHNAYRFSLSWPRIVPDGRGKTNPLGLEFYDKLIDGLLENGIEPNITLYHWDLPLTLAQDGGWENPHTVDAFLEYAKICLERCFLTLFPGAFLVRLMILRPMHPGIISNLVIIPDSNQRVNSMHCLRI